MAGPVFRPAKEHARLGIDSIAVLVLYLVGVIGLVVLTPVASNRSQAQGTRASGHEGRRVRLRQRDHRELDELVLLDPVAERSEPVGDLRLRCRRR